MPTYARSHMRLLTPVLVGFGAFVLAVLPACQTEQSARVDTSGPPPAGYETWDDYFEARDELIKDQEQQMQQDLQTNPMPYSAGGE